MRDAKGELWFVSFDAKGLPDAATGAILVANKIFWTLGYWQVENHLIRVRAEELAIDDSAEVTPPSGKRRPDEDERRRGGAAAGRTAAPTAPIAPSPPARFRGRPLGGFRYSRHAP